METLAYNALCWLSVETWYYFVSMGGCIASAIMLYVAFVQLRRIRLQQNFSSLQHVYADMDRLRKYWTAVYKQFADNSDFRTWSPEEKDNADILCMGLEKIAYLSEKKFIDETILLDEYAGVFAKTWFCLEEYVKHERVRRKGPAELKDNARFRKHYEQVALKAQKFYDRNGYDYKIDKQLATKS